MVLVLLASPAAALAAPPGNDDPQNATELVVSPPDGQLDTVDTTDATTYTGEPMTTSDATAGKCQTNGTQTQGNPDGPGTTMVKSAWWTFTGTGGRVTVSSYFSDFDTLMAVYTFESDNLLHFVKCNDDISFALGDLTSEAFFNTVAGKTYYVQVGGCDTCEFNGSPTPDHGTLGVYAWPAPGNDKRAGALPVTLNQNVAQATYGAQADGDTVLKCGTKGYGDTVWYRINLPGPGTLTLDASGFDSVVALYQGSAASPLACAVSPADAASSLTRHVPGGTFFAQVGGQESPGFAAWRGRLNFKASFTRDPVVKPTPTPFVTSNPDSDGDGEPDSTDCAPTDPKRSHLLPEIVGNKVDENCDNKVEDYPEVRATRGALDYSAGATTKLGALVVNRISKGDKVTITCRGKGCRKKKIVKTFSRARKSYAFKQVRRNRPGPGAVIEVRVTHPKRIGHAWRYTFRFFKAPKLKEDLCVRPGSSKAKACS
jgi:hypothetical protein